MKEMRVRGMNDESLLMGDTLAKRVEKFGYLTSLKLVELTKMFNKTKLRIFDSNMKSFVRVGNMEGHQRQRHQFVQLQENRKI
jgi:hypothetical protein